MLFNFKILRAHHFKSTIFLFYSSRGNLCAWERDIERERERDRLQIPIANVFNLDKKGLILKIKKINKILDMSLEFFKERSIRAYYKFDIDPGNGLRKKSYK
jgi:hypothetical protein